MATTMAASKSSSAATTATSTAAISLSSNNSGTGMHKLHHQPYLQHHHHHHIVSHQPHLQHMQQQMQQQQQHQSRSNYCNCSKFVPQAFNPNKCQQCFNSKEYHSAEALAEYSKSNRKVCKYGYMFIAPPDLDLNKTKRWQWRFFIFYDDSELTYSLDDNPLTLPQGHINISKCEEINELSINDPANADIGGLSSYPYSLRLKFSPPNKDIYIAAVNYEEIARWRDILSFHCRRHMAASSAPSHLIGAGTAAIQSSSTSSSSSSSSNSSTKNGGGGGGGGGVGKGVSHDVEDFDDIDGVDEDEEIEAVDEEVDEDDEDEDAVCQDDEDDDECHDEIRIKSSKSSSKGSSSSSSANSAHYYTNKNFQHPVKQAASNTSSSSSTPSNALEMTGKADDRPQSETDSMTGSGRRLSYKEDDLIRKQRLKENLNQLLIEYKHEEEAQLKKSSKFMLGSATNPTPSAQLPAASSTSSAMLSSMNKNRTSLDSCYSTSVSSSKYQPPAPTKSSAFSLMIGGGGVANPSQQQQQQQQQSNSQTNNSAFRPVVPAMTTSTNPGSTTSVPITVQNKSFSKLQKMQSNQPLLTTNSKSASTGKPAAPASSNLSALSWSSSCSSSSSSNSPPKMRQLSAGPSAPAASQASVSTAQAQADAQIYKKPCLISPRKAVSNEQTHASGTHVSNRDVTGGGGSGTTAVANLANSKEDSGSFSSSSILTSSSSSSSANSSTVMSSSHTQASTPNLASPLSALSNGAANKSLTILVRNGAGANSTTSTGTNGTLTNANGSVADEQTLSPGSGLGRLSQSKLSPSSSNTDLGSHHGSSSQYSLYPPQLSNGSGQFASNPAYHYHHHHQPVKMSSATDVTDAIQYSKLTLTPNEAPPSLSSSSDVQSTGNANNELIDLTKSSSRPQLPSYHRVSNGVGGSGLSRSTASTVNMAGYLVKVRDSSASGDHHSSGGVGVGGGDKYWFSLNSNLCCLMYWNDKYEQDTGKFPVGKYDFAKCCSVVRGSTSAASSNSGEASSDLVDCNLFKITFHQNTQSVTLRASCLENKMSWCDSLKHTIEHLSSVCSKCNKPKLIVNPMPLMSSSSSSNGMSSSTSDEQIQPLAPQAKHSLQSSNMLVLLGNGSATTSGGVKKISAGSKQKQQSPGASTLSSQQPSRSLSSGYGGGSGVESSESHSQQQLDNLKQLYEKLLQENADLTSKFKLLEQIHLDTINEYDKQQTGLFSQIDEMHAKCNRHEFELENLTKRLSQSKQSYEASLSQIQSLSDQLNKSKETIQSQEREIERLNKRLGGSAVSEQLYSSASSSSSSAGVGSGESTEAAKKDLSWNKEVKSLDARITDVLGKIKEREMSLTASSSDEALKMKCEHLQQQLSEAQAQLAQLKQEKLGGGSASTAANTKPLNLQDFSDDLGKVLMSKEEVITQLERQLADKEKRIQALTSQLNEEVAQTNKYQDALNVEMSRNSQLKHINDNLNEQYTCSTDEYDKLNSQLAKSTELVKELEEKLKQAYVESESREHELKSLQEYTHNEIETLQEEVKTLEYKFVHAQRQAQEYQSLLEDMDMANVSSFNQLNQNYFSGNLSLTPTDAAANSTASSNSIQNKLRRNQNQVQLVVQQLIQQKTGEIDKLKEHLMSVKQELDEVKVENADLNDHIYSVDVYMREKDQLCDQYQKERDDLLVKCNDHIKQIDHLNKQLFVAKQQQSEFEQATAGAGSYQAFLSKLHAKLREATRNFDEFLLFVANVCNQCLLDSLGPASSGEPGDERQCRIVLDLVNSLASSSGQSLMDLREFKRRYQSGGEATSAVAKSRGSFSAKSLGGIRHALDGLIKFMGSSDLNQFNRQIVSYMAEQLVHKAALNGHLKFACDLLRKKYGSAAASSSTGNTSSLFEAKASDVLSEKSEHDEKIFKLASELLMCDEDLLRKLSAQVLNESHHLAQLRCVLNTLRKIRLNQLNRRFNDTLAEIDEICMNDCISDIDDDTKDERRANHDDNGDDDERPNSDQAGGETAKNDQDLENFTGAGVDATEQQQLMYILDEMRDIFSLHKAQISDQLTEVHKLMSISSDDDMFTHLQNENAQLQHEISRLKQQLSNATSRSSSMEKQQLSLTGVSPTSQNFQKFSNSPSPSGGSLRKFSASSGLMDTPASTASSSGDTRLSPPKPTTSSFGSSGSGGHHHILKDLLSQDDTMC